MPRRRQWQPTPVFLPGKSHGRRGLVGCSPWGREETDTTERLNWTDKCGLMVFVFLRLISFSEIPSRSIYFSPNGKISLLMTRIPFLMWAASAECRFGCFPILTAVDDAVMNTGVPLPFWINVCSLFSDKYPNVELLDHMGNPRDGGAWGAAVYGVAQSRTRLKRRSSSSSSMVVLLSNFLRYFHSVFHGACTNLHFLQ